MASDPLERPDVVEVAGGFYVRVAVDNMAWIDLGGAALIVEALEQAHLADEVAGAIASTLGDTPVKYVLNTHPHGDHTALNGFFRQRYGAEIINQRVAPMGPEGRWFEGPRRRAQMLPMPDCHTPYDCVVWLPDARALFVGDIFGWGLIPLSRELTDAAAQLLIETHERLIAFQPEVVVPGHGPLCGAAELLRWVEYFQWLREGVARAVEAGKSDKQIAAELPPPQDMHGWWRFLLWKHEDSLGKVVRAIRSGALSA